MHMIYGTCYFANELHVEAYASSKPADNIPNIDYSTIERPLDDVSSDETTASITITVAEVHAIILCCNQFPFSYCSSILSTAIGTSEFSRQHAHVQVRLLLCRSCSDRYVSASTNNDGICVLRGLQLKGL